MPLISDCLPCLHRQKHKTITAQWCTMKPMKPLAHWQSRILFMAQRKLNVGLPPRRQQRQCDISQASLIKEALYLYDASRGSSTQFYYSSLQRVFPLDHCDKKGPQNITCQKRVLKNKIRWNLVKEAQAQACACVHLHRHAPLRY